MFRVIRNLVCYATLTVAVFISIPAAYAQLQRCPLIDQITLEECRTLEKLFFDTDGPNWINIRGWLRSNQPCEWYGITCESQGWPRKITKIDLSGNDLTGSLPGELSRLTELRELRIDNSGPGVRFRKLTGNLPAVLGQLEHLEILLLGDNDFTGSIPLEYGKLANLRELSLANSRLTGPIPESFGGLRNIHLLDLSGNQLAGGIPTVLSTLTSLEALDLSQNLLSGAIPIALGNLTNLRSLNLSGNDLTGTMPDTMANLNSLIWLSLADNELTGALPLRTAQFATTINACTLTGNDLCLPSNSVYEQLGDDPICGLPKDDACKICVGPDCPALESIFESTTGTTWTNASLWLATRNPCDWHGVDCADDRVTRLVMPNNTIEGALPDSLADLTHLGELNLANNALTGNLPTSLAGLPALSVIDLSDNQLSGTVPLSVASLGAAAQICDLSGNIGLCMPNEPEYRALGQSAICGIDLRPLCGEFPLVLVNDLRVIPLEQSAQLSWQVSTSAEGLRFDIETINNGTPEVAGSVLGSQQAPAEYSFVVPNLGSGWHTLQIRQVSPSGAFSVSDAVSVRLYKPSLEITGPYPNPFTTQTQLTLVTGSTMTVQVDVFDVTGRKVQALFDGQPALHTPWSLRFGDLSLPGGTYFIRILTQDAVQSYQVQYVK